MLRFILLLLLIANGIYYAWSAGLLSQWGWTPHSQRESFRLKEQINPERIIILPSDRPADNSKLPVTSSSTSTSNAPNPLAQNPTQTPAQPNPVTASARPQFCLTAGTFTDKQSSTLKQALATKLPEIAWRFDKVTIPAKWIVYMGKYPNNQARDVKKLQLDQLNVKYELLTGGALEPGLSLGSHPSQVAANQALQSLEKKGVHTARVLQESPEQQAQRWVAPSVDEATRAKLNTVYATLASQLDNTPLQICK